MDDAIAILMALASPRLDVVGLTTVGGNVPRARATRNALAILQAAGRTDIPVALGAARPLAGRYRPSVAFHGTGGLSARLPDPDVSAVASSAVDFLDWKINAAAGTVTLVALGPLTNLARLERIHPGTLARCASVLIMGGAVDTRGNVTPHAEFNFHSDALAASRVLALDAPMALVDLAACRQVGISREQAGRLSADKPIGNLALRILQGWFARDDARERFEFYDPLAVALAIDSSLATTGRVGLAVGTEPGDRWGETTVVRETGPVSLAIQVDETPFFSLLADIFGWQGM